MTFPRPCLEPDCREVVVGAARCDEHRRARLRARSHNPMYDDVRWARLRRKLIGRHVKRHGYLCPGWQREPHLARTLSVDHITPDTLGGAKYEESNLQILCTECNASKGSQVGRVGLDTPGYTPGPESDRAHPCNSRSRAGADGIAKGADDV